MSESQMFHQVVPTIKKSTLDTHQIISPAARPPRGAHADDDADRKSRTRPALRSPQTQHENNGPTGNTDVVFKKQPIDARMQPGGVVVKGTDGAELVQRERRSSAVAQPTRAKILGGVVLSDAQRTLLKQLVTAHAENVGGVQLSLAEATLEALK